MGAIAGPIPSEISARLLLVRLVVEAPAARPADLKNNRSPKPRPPLAMRVPLALARFVIAFCIGAAAAIAWQSYGGAAREIIASASPKLGWLAAQAAPVAQDAPDTIVPAVPSPDQQQLKAVSFDLDAMRQKVDQIATSQEQIMQTVDRLAANQREMGRDIINLQAISQYALYKNSEATPRATPARVPMPVPRPSRARMMR
jgi:hypothetical protein